MKCLILISVVVHMSAVSAFDDDDAEKVRDFMNGLNECRGIPGDVVTLVRDGEVLFAEGFGFANLEEEKLMTADTKLPIASVSKQFTTTHLAKLIEDSDSINWDSIVRDVLGDSFHFADGYRSNNTNLRDVAAHRTGIHVLNPAWTHGQLTRDQIIQRVRFHPITSAFRLDLQYNNNMYSVAGKVAEVITGMGWEEAITQDILLPLGMNETGFYDDGLASGYAGWETPYIPNILGAEPEQLVPGNRDLYLGIRDASPGGGMVSTGWDMGQWLKFVLGGGRTVDDQPLVSNTSLKELQTPQIHEDNYNGLNDLFSEPHFPVTFTKNAYGLGYFLGYYRGYRVVEHGGTLNGYHSMLSMLPDMELGIFFHCNYGLHTLERYMVTMFLFDVLLNEEPFMDAEWACEFLEETNKIRDIPERFPIEQRNDYELLVDKISQYTSNEDLVRSMVTLIMYDQRNGTPSKFLLDKLKTLIPNRGVNISQNMRYIGTYGNFALGNVTVEVIEDSLHLLMGERGRWRLEEQDEDLMLAFALENLPAQSILTVLFSGDSDGQAINLEIPTFHTEEAVFVRDLTMEQAPPPNVDCS